MKNIALFSLIIVLIFYFSPDLKGQEDPGDKVADLIRKGNARELARHFNVSVQLTLPQDEGRFSSTQAELIIRNFFLKHPPRSFDISHRGSSSDGSRYFIGVYKSTNKTFRSYYLLKQVAEKSLIHQLRFEEDD